MSWPSPQDYNEAVQTPLVSFLDDALKSGSAQLNSYGLPRPISGTFASVYRFQCQQNEWAVRCFLQRVDGQEERYRLLTDYLKQQHPQSMVSFEFLREGILVHGSWYPILKMEWVEGETLSSYVDKNHRDAQLMLALAGTFETICSELAQVGIAHGDLQHGNIMICGDRIRLVDYDGMYIPPLQGMQSNELGHRNYQHPGRQRHHFGSYLDNFSAWVISGSLRALADDPSLWETLRGGDECLLFRQKDYAQPLESMAFSTLEHHENREVALIGRTIRSFLDLSVERVPPLGSHIDLPAMADTPAVSEIKSLLQKRAANSNARNASWVRDWASEDGATKLDTKIVVDADLLDLAASPPALQQAPAPTGKRQSEAIRNLIAHELDAKSGINNNANVPPAFLPNPKAAWSPVRSILPALAMSGFFLFFLGCYYDSELKRVSGNYHTSATVDPTAQVIDQSTALAKQAETERKNGSFQDAVLHADQAARLNNNNADAYYTKGMAEASLNQAEAAESDLSSAIYVRPNGYPGAYYALGTLEEQRNATDEAIRHLRTFTQLRPQDAYGWLELAKAYTKDNNYSDALTALNQASQIGLPESDMSQFYMTRGNVFEKTRRFDSAIADYNEYIRLVPSDADGYSHRGFVYSQVKSWRQAVANYTIALNKSQSPDAYYNRALAYYNLKNFSDALADIRKYRDFVPQDSAAAKLQLKIMASKGY